MISVLIGEWERFVERVVMPSVREAFKKVGIEVRVTFQRATASINGKSLVIDIVGIGRDRKGRKIVFIIAEVKDNLNQREIHRAVKVFEKFTEFFPEYKGEKIIGVVAGKRIGKVVKSMQFVKDYIF